MNQTAVKHNIYFKVAAIAIITLLLLIPAAMIKELIRERESTQQEAFAEVGSKWSGPQTIAGPFISIPYIQYNEVITDGKKEVTTSRQYLHVLPSVLNISGDLKPEKRSRGIYDIIVYDSKITFSGNFAKADFSSLDIAPKDLLLDQAEFVVGIDDLRGLETQVELKWNDQQASFNPGVTTKQVVESGINAPIAIAPGDSDYRFSLALQLKGSQRLYFTPLGKVTDVQMASSWPTPSFNGAFLPDSREVSDKGFSARWNVLHLNRNYPQRWTGSDHAIRESAFGIDLLLPVDNYQKSFRSIKYAILFIVFTFLAFFFIEVMNKIAIHPVQYILVGIALIVFYTLLLSFSEHVTFNAAFALSALATLGLIAGYTRAVLRSGKLSLFITSLISMLYIFIFVIIQLEDFALLIGSIGLFVILGGVMYFSRQIDWYNLSLNESPAGGNQPAAPEKEAA